MLCGRFTWFFVQRDMRSAWRALSQSDEMMVANLHAAWATDLFPSSSHTIPNNTLSKLSSIPNI